MVKYNEIEKEKTLTWPGAPRPDIAAADCWAAAAAAAAILAAEIDP